MKKEKVLAITLCSSQQGGWIHPDQVQIQIAMTHDPHYQVNIAMLKDYRGFDFARNTAMDLARKAGADVLIIFDNDSVPAISPLEVLRQAKPDMAVIGLPAAAVQGGGFHFTAQNGHLVDDHFLECEYVGGGCLIIRSEIWRKIPAPWFRWETTGELLAPKPNACEDYYFCSLVRRHGYKVYSHNLPLAHYKSVDVSALAMQSLAKAATQF